MSAISPIISQKIKNMSIVCALLVVAIHVEWPHDSVCASWFIKELIARGVSRVAVPFFFVVSGYFLARHFDDSNWYLNEINKRKRTLLIPYIFWLILSIVATIPLAVVSDFIAHRPLGASVSVLNGHWMSVFGLDLRHCPFELGALWYVRCLMIFVLVSPVFKFLVRRYGISWIVIAFILTLVHRSTNWGRFNGLHQFFDIGFSLEGACYFSFGVFLSYKGKIGRLWGPKTSVFLLVFFMAISATFKWFGVALNFSLNSFAIPFMLYSMWILMPSRHWPIWLTSFSFPLFLIHMLVLQYFFVAIKHFAFLGTGVGSCIVYVGTLVFSFSVMRIVVKSPVLSEMLFAGRV